MSKKKNKLLIDENGHYYKIINNEKIYFKIQPIIDYFDEEIPN